MYKVSISDYFGNDIEIEVDGDYQPYENQTWTYPGCSEQFDIGEAYVIETGAEICFIGDTEMDIQEQILDKIHEDKSYKKYGYLMEN